MECAKCTNVLLVCATRLEGKIFVIPYDAILTKRAIFAKSIALGLKGEISRAERTDKQEGKTTGEYSTVIKAVGIPVKMNKFFGWLIDWCHNK